jgi:hypothetical protein
MDKKHPDEALQAYYDTVDLADVSSLVQAHRQRPAPTWAGNALGFASACALGIGIAVAIAYVPAVAPKTEPEGTSWRIREQMARNGLNPDELLGSDARRSEAVEVLPWRA